jgi:hypothetical protein
MPWGSTCSTLASGVRVLGFLDFFRRLSLFPEAIAKHGPSPDVSLPADWSFLSSPRRLLAAQIANCITSDYGLLIMPLIFPTSLTVSADTDMKGMLMYDVACEFSYQ